MKLDSFQLFTLPILILCASISLICCEQSYDLDNNNLINDKLSNDKINHTDLLLDKSSLSLDILNTLSDYATLQLTLAERVEIERKVWHWYPYRRINYHLTATGDLEEDECKESNAIDDFPDDLFTQRQREQGAIILHLIGAIYAFTMLGYVIGRYFIPSVECICEDLKISPDVAAATFMATATTLPEFFTNVISTFISDSDMGLGNVIGSMLFNTLGVAAFASLAAPKAVQLDWWPLTRDSVIFGFHVSILIVFAWDGRMEWWESMVLVILYFNYFIVMFQSNKLRRMVMKIENKFGCCVGKPYHFPDIEENSIPANNNDDSNGDQKGITNSAYDGSNPNIAAGDINQSAKDTGTGGSGNDYVDRNLWKFPKGETKLRQFWFFYSWSIKVILKYTVPDPYKHRRFYPLAFVMCILWIGGSALFIFWMVAMIGYTFNIPDSVMGMTFLAAGGCLPEAVSAIIMIRKGDGGMGISNSLGANSLAVLFSLGIPWLARSIADGGPSEDDSYVDIHSYGLEWIILSLSFALVILNIILYIGKYQLKRLVGITLLCTYSIFVTFAVLVEVDVFFDGGDC